MKLSSFSVLISTLLVATITTTTVVLGQPVESWCPVPPKYASLGEDCPGKTEGKKCFTETTNPNTVAVLCENGNFVATTPFVGEAFVDPPNMAPTPCSGTGSTAEGGCVLSPPIVMGPSKDANDTDVSGIDVVDTLNDESTTVASTSTSGSVGTTSASNNVVTWGSCVAAFGSVVVVALL